MTWTQIKNKILTLLADNAPDKDISAADIREILTDMANMNIPVIPIHIITYYTQDIAVIANGSTIAGKVVSTGDNVFLSNQTDPTENGIYTIGLNAGDTERHADYPDLASCADKLIISTYPDENGNSLVNTSLDGASLTSTGTGKPKLEIFTATAGQTEFPTSFLATADSRVFLQGGLIVEGFTVIDGVVTFAVGQEAGIQIIIIQF